MYGIAMGAQAGVIYDSLGIVGARASRMLNFDEGHLAGQIAHRSPDLLVVPLVVMRRRTRHEFRAIPQCFNAGDYPRACW